MDKSKLNNYFHSLFPIQKEIVEKITETFCDFSLYKNTTLLNKDAVALRKNKTV